MFHPKSKDMADDRKIEAEHIDQPNGDGFVNDKPGPDSYAADAERQGSRQGSRSQSVSLNRNVTAR